MPQLAEAGVLDVEVKLALDGQSAAPAAQRLKLYAVPRVAGMQPSCAPHLGETKLLVSGHTFFASSDLTLRLTALAPLPEPEPEPEPEEAAPTGEEEPAAAEEEPAAEEGAPAAEAGEEAAEAEAEAEAEGDAAGLGKLQPPVEPMEEGHLVEVAGKFDPESGGVLVTLPPLGGAGRMAVAMALNGVDFVDVPGELVVYGRVGVREISPALGSRSGGTSLELRGPGLRAAPELSVAFFKGATKLSVAAEYDATARCVRCKTPAWPDEDDDGDVIVEVALNGQQLTQSCVHFLFQDAEVSAAEPATGPITGETPLRLTGNGFVATPTLRVRFTRVEPEDTPAPEGIPASLEVEATVAEDGAIECVTPVFEGAEEPFDTMVQVSLDGQHYSEKGGGSFRFEGGGAKKKK